MSARHWKIYRSYIVATLADIGEAEQLVATRGDSLLGTVLLNPPGKSFGENVGASMSDDCPEVRLLAVAPEGRGLGVGRALMDQCVRPTSRTGAPGVVLHTMAMMKAARRVYDDMGSCAPELAFAPAKNWQVEGFRLPLARD